MNPKKIFVVMMALVVATFIISLAPAFGQVDTAWVRRYNGPGSSADHAHAIAVDGSGNVCVTGKSDLDYATLKYHPNGDTGWVRRYEGFSTDWADDIAVDGSGNVYVTGRSLVDYDRLYDYTTIKYYSNGDRAWVRLYGYEDYGTDDAFAIAVYDPNNIYVTGVSARSVSGFDYATVKYDSFGNEIWVRRYNYWVDSSDFAYAIDVDGSNNVCVTGKSVGFGTGYDYATIKYNGSGTQLWASRYNGTGNEDDEAYAIAIDVYGNVCVTGRSWGSGTGWDYATAKYDPDGNELWVGRYNGPANSDDVAEGIAVDGSGNVYVTGWSIGNGTNYDYATIKYYPNGDTAWVRRYSVPGNYADLAYAIAVDGFGNVYVTGVANVDYTTIKYDALGNERWVITYDGPGHGWDKAYAISLDVSGNVYVTGESWGSGTSWDYATIKYIQLTYMPGDVNNDWLVDLEDVLYLINYLYQGGPEPQPELCVGEVNGQDPVDLGDLLYLISYLYKGGPPPLDGCE